MAARSTASTSRCRACCTPRSRLRRCSAASWSSVDTARRGEDARRQTRRAARGGRGGRRRHLLAGAQGAGRAQAAVRRCRTWRACRARRSSTRSTRRSARRPTCRRERRDGDHRRLPRAVSPARDDGADGVHGAGARRSRRGVGRHAGSAERAQARRPRRSDFSAEQVQYTNLALGGGFGRKLPVVPRFRRHERAHREGDVAGAGEDDLEPRDRHAARLLPARGDGALRRRARRRRHAARGRVRLRRRRRRRIDVHAVCDCRQRRRRRATRSTTSAPARGVRCSTRSTASSRSRSSTRWRTPRRRIRSRSAAT